MFDVTVILPRRSDEQLLRYIRDQGVRIEFIDSEADVAPARSLRRKLERHVNKLRSERKLVARILDRDLDSSIVHVELSPWQSLISLLRLCRRSKVFITAHNALGNAPWWRRAIWTLKLRAIASCSGFRFFPSNKNSRDYFARYFPAAFIRDRTTVTYTSVDPVEIDAVLGRDFDKDVLLRRHGIPTGKPIVLCVGQFIDRKGRWTFLDAASRLRDTAEVQFVWISNSDPSAADIERVQSYGLGDRFSLIRSDDIGSDRQSILTMFRIADVFVLASFVEGLPISLLEAMALGVPSISTNVNAIPEALKDRDTGLLIEPGDGEALAAAISELLTDTGLRKRLGRVGREWVVHEFDEREVARLAIRRYLEALQ